MNKAIDNYVLKEIVGEGQYGKVYKAFNTQTYGLYAVKVIRMDKFREVPKLEEFTLNEIRILSKIEHPNIVRFVQILKTSNHMYLVYEYCEQGTLEELISSKRYLSEEETLAVARQLLSAFKVLSENGILHRDIKPSNILFNGGTVKLADFGFCKSLAPNEMTNTMVGSPIYMAPEVLKGSPYTSKADVWSFGVVLYECLYGFCPYEDRSIGKLIKLINNKDLYFPPVPKISRQLTELIHKMLTISPSKRISWEGLLSSPLFKEKHKSDLLLSKLQDIEYYKSVESPRITSRSEEESSRVVQNFMLFVWKERRKILFLAGVAQEVVRKEFAQTYTRIAQLLLSRCKDVHSRMFRSIRDLDVNHQYTQSQRAEIKNSKELASFVEIVTAEHIAIEECYRFYKAANSLVSTDEPTLKLYSEEILQYVREVSDEQDRERLLHCNQLLDCIMLMELFENYVGTSEHQQELYCYALSKLSLGNLQHIVTHKIKYAEKKYRGL